MHVKNKRLNQKKKELAKSLLSIRIIGRQITFVTLTIIINFKRKTKELNELLNKQINIKNQET